MRFIDLSTWAEPCITKRLETVCSHNIALHLIWILLLFCQKSRLKDILLPLHLCMQLQNVRTRLKLSVAGLWMENPLF